MQIGKRIFFDKLTGNVILDTGEKSGATAETTIERDVLSFTVLSERNRETFDVLELPFGAYAQDFAESNGYRVNPETKKLEFSERDPNEPDEPQVFQKPLSEQIKDLELKTDQAVMELTMIIAMGGIA